MCKQLLQLNIEFFRHLKSNIITIKSQYIHKEVALEFGLVPDNHASPQWFKVVIMEHVTIEKLMLLIEMIKDSFQKDK